jgi:hypothetical protein
MSRPKDSIGKYDNWVQRFYRHVDGIHVEIENQAVDGFHNWRKMSIAAAARRVQEFKKQGFKLDRVSK